MNAGNRNTILEETSVHVSKHQQSVNVQWFEHQSREILILQNLEIYKEIAFQFNMHALGFFFEFIPN